VPQRIFTAKPIGDRYAAAAIERLCSSCDQCQFTDALKKDDRGRYVKGDWKQALLTRNDPSRDTVVTRENVNGFLKHVPCVVLPKGTELFHVTASSAWVRTSVVGANDQDDGYSFFTLRTRGFAGVHGNQFSARIQLRLREDIHGFFCPVYDFDTYSWGEYTWSNGKKQPAVVKGAVDKGGGLITNIKEAWPGALRPMMIMGCSECEVIIHSSMVPHVTETTAIATSTDNFKTRSIVNIGELPASKKTSEGAPRLTAPPGNWLNPSKEGDIRAARAEAATKDPFNAAHAALFGP
jgi:hypothetical protein